MVLTSVDLPAPLSPTRASTSPARTSSSMFFKAWTAPKRLETPRSASTVPVATGVGVTVIDSAPERFVHDRAPAAPPASSEPGVPPGWAALLEAGGRAGGRERRGADV